MYVLGFESQNPCSLRTFVRNNTRGSRLCTKAELKETISESHFRLVNLESCRPCSFISVWFHTSQTLVSTRTRWAPALDQRPSVDAAAHAQGPAGSPQGKCPDLKHTCAWRL